APLHGVAARGGAGARPVGQARAARAAGRRAEPDRSAFGLPFPHALSVCRRALQGGTAGTAPSAAGPIGGLPSAIVHPELPTDSVELAGLRSGCGPTLPSAAFSAHGSYLGISCRHWGRRATAEFGPQRRHNRPLAELA